MKENIKFLQLTKKLLRLRIKSKTEEEEEEKCEGVVRRATRVTKTKSLPRRSDSEHQIKHFTKHKYHSQKVKSPNTDQDISNSTLERKPKKQKFSKRRFSLKERRRFNESCPDLKIFDDLTGQVGFRQISSPVDDADAVDVNTLQLF